MESCRDAAVGSNRADAMPIAIVATILVQIACAVHAVRTGRPYYWIFIIMAAPMLGCIVYLIVAVLPDLAQSRTANRTADRLIRAVDPERELRRLIDLYEIADTVENRRALAEEYLAQGQPAKAIELFRATLVGVHRDDPVLLFGLARAEFASGDHGAAASTLERLRQAKPVYAMPVADLLHARALEEIGRTDEALKRYADAVARLPGTEARYRYGVFLKRLGRHGEGDALLREVVRSYERAGRPFREAQREWYELARRHLE
jgi:hypothetical protein